MIFATVVDSAAEAPITRCEMRTGVHSDVDVWPYNPPMRSTRPLWFVVLGFVLAACAEVDVDRRLLATDIAESIETPDGFERVGEIVVEDPGFGLFGSEAGSVVHEWTPNDNASTSDVFEVFDPVVTGAGYERITVLCTSEDLAVIYWHPDTGTGVLDRVEQDGVISIGLSSSWSNDVPTDDITPVGPQDCSGG